ncbi:MAG: DUF2059 domain-containing protein [Moraxellaceae bacterium]|nr:DUF2059 domain-containing protein [Moraxellaceae bacterium]
MIMLRTWLLAALLALPVTTLATTAPETKRELAERYFSIAGLDATYTDKRKIDAMLQAMIKDMLNATAASMTPDQVSAFNKHMDNMMPSINELVQSYLGRMKPEMVSVITETYTIEELNALIAFYSSPEGRNVVAKSPSIVNGMMAVTNKHSGQLTQELYNILVSHIQAVMTGHIK